MDAFSEDDNNWIPVSKALPKPKKPVMVSNGGQIITSASYENGEWIEYGGRKLSDVTHWKEI